MYLCGMKTKQTSKPFFSEEEVANLNRLALGIKTRSKQTKQSKVCNDTTKPSKVS